VLLLSSDPDLQAHLKQSLREATLTVAKDPASLPRSEIKRTYDGVILETKDSMVEALAKLERSIDPSRTFILAGARPVLKHASHVVRAVAGSNGFFPKAAGQEFSLEDYVESKLTDFVKGMKHTSARNLYAMLMEAVERPLITLVLKETNGNQTQAAHVLGMNRNTLRKKIAEFRISVKREKSVAP
jgi:two-component system nitrogen regulation response regulator GlnG